MSISRAKTQMIKERDRLIGRIDDLKTKREDIDKIEAALKAQIEAIEAALTSLNGETVA